MKKFLSFFVAAAVLMSGFTATSCAFAQEESAKFNAEHIDAVIGDTINLTLSTLQDEPVANADIAVDGSNVGKTDENGNIEIHFPSDGSYKISSIESDNVAAADCTISVVNPYCEALQKRACGAGNYLIDVTDSFTIDNAVDFLAALLSGAQISETAKNSFLASLDSSLEENNGRIISSFGTEDLGIYGAVIGILKEYGYDAENYKGHNVYTAFEMVPTDSISSPYNYKVAIDNASDAFAHKLCERFIEDYYTLGVGMNYWGVSCDNTAQLLTAISKYKSDYKDYVVDAAALLKSYIVDGGCYFSAQYGTDANANSTAAAMMAFASIGDTALWTDLYSRLIENFESADNTGVMIAYGSEDIFATKDALLAFEYANREIKPFGHIYGYSKSSSTCANAGKKYYTCIVCDAEKTTKGELLAHTFKTSKATLSKSGAVKCTVCGYVKSTISYPKTFSLSTTVYTYNGSAKKPTVTVKDSKGKKISAENYSVSYSNNTKAGKASVKISFKGNYTGTKTLYFTIKPKGTSITKVSAGKKSFTVKWKKQAIQTSGYQVQYSTSSKFTNATTKTVSSTKTTSKKISKLKGKKKYYVRVRTYKTVNGKKYYSSWSKTKTVTTKK